MEWVLVEGCEGGTKKKKKTIDRGPVERKEEKKAQIRNHPKIE